VPSEVVLPEAADGDLGIADVEDEEHGWKVRR
jgi:hypothetical protein